MHIIQTFLSTGHILAREICDDTIRIGACSIDEERYRRFVAIDARVIRDVAGSSSLRIR